MTSTALIARRWRHQLINIEMMREYSAFMALEFSLLPHASPAPVMEHENPILLVVCAVTTLDDALAVMLGQLGEDPVKRGFENDLNGRIETALASGILNEVELLHRVRRLRENLPFAPMETITWPRLDEDIAAIHAALQTLGFAGDRSPMVAWVEKKPKTSFMHPRASVGVDYVVSVRIGRTVHSRTMCSIEA